VMGAGAAFIMPSTLSILVNVFPPHERTKAIAIWAATTGAAGAIGPVASGWLLGHFWYGSIFLVNVPIVIITLIAGQMLIPRLPRLAAHPFDKFRAGSCKKRKDGAPSAGMVHAEVVKGGHPPIKRLLKGERDNAGFLREGHSTAV